MFSSKSLIFACGLALTLLLGCKSKESDPLGDFAEIKQKTLNGQEIRLASDSLLYLPYNFAVHDSIGIFNDNSGRTAVTLINLNNGRLIKKMVYSGGLPSEFDINAISISRVLNQPADFTVLQINAPCKIIRYNWPKVLQDVPYQPTPLYQTRDYGYANAFLLNDSTVFGQLSYSKFDTKLFGITKIASRQLVTGLDIPRFKDKAFDHYYEDKTFYNTLKSVLDLKLRARPAHPSEFAYFSSNGALFQIFTIDKALNFKVKNEKVYFLPLFNVVRSSKQIRSKMLPESKSGFGDVAVTSDKIYTLYNGSKKNDVFTDHVLVYDWDGHPLDHIQLDRKCRNIAISENEPRVMYGMYGKASTRIVKYRLP